MMLMIYCPQRWSVYQINTRGDVSQSDNYRGISMCNCICKLFDVILMKKCDKVLHTSDQQFAFKQKHSTAMCSSVLIETVNYFVKCGSNVYGCFLDASKAFDKVHYGKLFSLLMSKSLPNVVVRFIKKGDAMNVCNYRPVSILPIVSKIYEKEMVRQLEKYF